jgi:replicative DNA helicase
MPDEIRNRLVNTLTKSALYEHSRKKNLPIPKSISEVSIERTKERMLESMAPSTGSPALDRFIKGFVPGHLYTMTGDENVGKTSLACNFAINVAVQGKKVLYFALEPENTVVDYLASVRFDKYFDDLLPEELSFDDEKIHVYGKQDVRTVDELVAIIESLTRYDLIIIDHIGYFVTDLRGNIQEQSNIIKKLAGLAKAKRCAIMMIAHLRKRDKTTKKKRTIMSDDIAGSAAFKQDSTEVLIMTRDYEDNDSDDLVYQNTGYLHVAKTKCGPNGKIRVEFQTKKAKIYMEGDSWIDTSMNLEGRAEGSEVDFDDTGDGYPLLDGEWNPEG